MKAILFVLILTTITAQECQTVIQKVSVYPVLSEQFSQSLNGFFRGNDLVYSTNSTVFGVTNNLNKVDKGNALPTNVNFSASAVLSFQNTEEWAGKSALLGNTSTQTFVYLSSLFSNSTPNYNVQVPLLQSQGALSCLGLGFIDASTLFVDCYNVNLDGTLQNEWQYVDLTNTSKLPEVFPSSNTQGVKSNTPGFGRVVQYWKNLTSGNQYIFQGTLNNQGFASFLDVFKLDEQGVPGFQPVNTITSIDITGLQLTDFEIAPNGTLFLLNATNVLVSYNLNESTNHLIKLSTYQLSDGNEYFSLDVGIDFQSPTSGSYTILLTSNNNGVGVIEEYVAYPNHMPIFAGSYIAEGPITYSGVPPYVDINTLYVIFQYQGTAQLFQRGTADLNPQTYEPFTQRVILKKIVAEYVELNKLPETALVIDKTNAQMYNLSSPSITTYQTTPSEGNFTLVASSGSLNCSTTVSFKFIPTTDVSIYPSETNSLLPTTALYPINQTLDISLIAIGPSLSASGSIEGSQVVETTLQKTPIQLSGYPNEKSGVQFAQNFYDADSKTTLQVLQTKDNKVQIYACYKTIYDAYIQCLTVGSFSFQSKLTQVSIVYTDVLRSTYFVLNDGTQGYVYSVKWDVKAHSGTIKQLYNLKFTYNNQSYQPNDILALGDRLFVVLTLLNQVWVYKLTEAKEQYLYAIDSTVLGVANFLPIQVTGQLQTFGPILFVNNQYQALIIQTVDDRPFVLSSQDYPSLFSNGLSQIQLVGTNLIVIQSKSGSQQITQYSVANILAPQLVKYLPLENTLIQVPFVISSDNNFLYVLMNGNLLNIYKPSLSFHQSLFQQFSSSDIGTGSVLFTSSSTEYGSSVFFANSSLVQNYLLSTQPAIVIMPGPYSNAYTTTKTYSVVIHNNFQQSLTLNSNLTIYNTQLQINIDQKKFDSQKTLYRVQSKGQSNYVLDPSSFISGNIADYAIDCALCRTGNITLQNFLYPLKQNILSNIQASTNLPGKSLSFVQSNSSLWKVTANSQLSPTLYRFFNGSYTSCPAIATDGTANRVFSVCSVGTTIQLIVTDVSANVTVIDQTVTGVVNPTEAKMLGKTLFVKASLSGVNQQSIFMFNYTDQLATLQNTFKCAGNAVVNDFELINLKQGGKYVLMVTCSDQIQGVNYWTLTQDSVNLNITQWETNPTQLNVTVPQYSLLNTTQYYQIQDLTGVSGNKVSLLLTTNNLVNFILNYQITVGTLVVFSDPTLVTTIPPYGLWATLNYLSYQNQLLALSFYNKDVKQQFVAIYQINDVDFGKTTTSPLLMYGGFYQPLNDIQQTPWYLIQESTSSNNGVPETRILTGSPQYNYNLSAIGLDSRLRLKVVVNGKFEDQKALITAQNFYNQKQFTVVLSYQSPEGEEGLKWWGWFLIVLGIIVLVGGIGFAVVKFRASNRQQPLLG